MVSGDIGDAHFEEGQAVGFSKGTPPLCAVLVIAPLTFHGSQELGRAIGKGGFLARESSNLRINAGRQCGSQLAGLFTRSRQAKSWIATQA